MEPTTGFSSAIIRALLFCGIGTAVFIICTDIIAGLLKPGYNFATQSASLLSASGSSTRHYVLPLNIISYVLFIAFAVGVWFSAENNWALRVTSGLLAAQAILSLTAVAFFPLHPNEGFETAANKIHMILMVPAMFLFVLAISSGAVGNPNWFRYFSAGIILLFVVLTILGLWVFPHLGSGQPVTRVGVQERTMIYSEMVWLALQALVLLRIL